MQKEKLRTWGRRLPCACFFCCLLCLLLALAGFMHEWPVNELVLVRDVSASMLANNTQDRQSAAFTQKLQPSREVNILFAGTTQISADTASPNKAYSIDMERLHPEYTNLQAAIEKAAQIQSNGLHRRKVIAFTDGRENRGNAAGALKNHAATMQVNFVPRGGELLPDARVYRVDLPQKILPDRNFNLSVVCSASPAQPATVKIYQGEKLLAEKKTQLSPRQQSVPLTLMLSTPGVSELRAEIVIPEDKVPQNDSCNTLAQVRSQGKVLWLGSTPPATLTTSFNLDTAQTISGVNLNDYSLIVFTDNSLQALLDTPATVTEYIKNGGTVVLEYTAFFLQQVIRRPEAMQLLPTDPANNTRAATVFLLDISGSMAENAQQQTRSKLDISTAALSYVLSSFDKGQRAGVLAFNMSTDAIVPLSAGPFNAYDAQLKSLHAGGGTDIFTALSRATKMLQNTPALQKQIVLLTDGADSEKEDALTAKIRQAREELKSQRIRLDIVAVGEDADITMLQELSQNLGEVTVAVDKMTVLPAVLEQQVDSWSGQGFTAGKSTLNTAAADYANIFADNLTIEKYLRVGPLRTGTGYRDLLTVKDGNILLAQGGVGLGRVIAISGDPSSMWQAGKPAEALWQRILKQNITTQNKGELQVRRLTNSLQIIWKPKVIASTGWNVVLHEFAGGNKTIATGKLVPHKEGVWDDSLPIPVTGKYLVQILNDQNEITESQAILVDDRAEYLYYGADAVKLESLAAISNGDLLYSPAQDINWDNVIVAGKSSRLPQYLLFAALGFLMLGILLKGLLP